MNTRNSSRQTPASQFRLPKGLIQALNEHRVCVSLRLPQLTRSDGEWLGRVLSSTLGHIRAQTDAVVVKDVTLRYRPARLGVADAMDAVAELLAPLSAAGAAIEPRDDWYIADDDDDNDNDDDDDDDEKPARPAWHEQFPDEDLLVRLRVEFNATADDVGAAVLHWVLRSLAN